MNEASNGNRPSACASIRISTVHDGYIAYDTGRDVIHHLNPTASLIFELCDGRRSVSEIAEAAGRILGKSSEYFDDVEQWLARAAVRGLVTFGGVGPRAEPREMDAETLSRAAEKLKEKGRTDWAFSCQQRAAELDPDDPDIWYALGDLAHIEGDRETARTAYARYLKSDPDDAEVAHILVALGDGATPARMPDDCVTQIFDRYSTDYDESMRGELDYCAPEVLLEVLERALPRKDAGLDVLDLGCGTGLAGKLLRPLARRLDGVDISPEMIGQARKLGSYDSLDVAEITDWLCRAATRSYDLVAACDVLVYFGDLAPIFEAVRRILKPGGCLAFTVERGDGDGVKLSDSGRFAHSEDYLEETAQTAGLEIGGKKTGAIRTEYGEPVEGIAIVLRNAELHRPDN